MEMSHCFSNSLFRRKQGHCTQPGGFFTPGQSKNHHCIHLGSNISQQPGTPGCSKHRARVDAVEKCNSPPPTAVPTLLVGDTIEEGKPKRNHYT